MVPVLSTRPIVKRLPVLSSAAERLSRLSAASHTSRLYSGLATIAGRVPSRAVTAPPVTQNGCASAVRPLTSSAGLTDRYWLVSTAVGCCGCPPICSSSGLSSLYSGCSDQRSCASTLPRPPPLRPCSSEENGTTSWPPWLVRFATLRSVPGGKIDAATELSRSDGPASNQRTMAVSRALSLSPVLGTYRRSGTRKRCRLSQK